MEINQIPFLSVIKDITSKFSKIPNKNFIDKGSFAVVDQSVELIAGYTNDESKVTGLGYPVIVFGDHTRIIKYIDFPFAIGADGVKVLSVDTELAFPEYVYYFLKLLKIPNAGYSRHYKFLKEKKIALPKSIDDQKRIAKILSSCEVLIQKRKESIDLLDLLLKSTFLEMFGDTALNQMKWDKVPLKQFGKIITGNTPSRSNAENYSSNFIEWIKTDNIKVDKTYITQASEYLSELGLKNARTINSGALLIACIAGSIESVGRAALTNRIVSFNQQINAIQPNKEIEPLFLYWVFKISKNYIQGHATKGMKKILTKGEFEKIKMIKPPLELQTKFSQIVEKANAIKEQYLESLQELENLYRSLSQQAFKGELDLSKVEIEEEEVVEVEDISLTKEMKLYVEQTKQIQKQIEVQGDFVDNLRLTLKNIEEIKVLHESFSKSRQLPKIVIDAQKNFEQVLNSIPVLDYTHTKIALNWAERVQETYNNINKSIARVSEIIRPIEEFGSYIAPLNSLPVIPPYITDVLKNVEKIKNSLPRLLKNEKVELPAKKVDISNLTLLDFLGVPAEIQLKDENFEFNLIGDDIFYQFLLKDGFPNKDFTYDEIVDKFHNYFYHNGNMDFNHEQWKGVIFRFLEAQPPLLLQEFNEEDKRIKLKLTNEAFKA